MEKYGEEAGRRFNSAPSHYAYEISFKRHRDDTIFENLPVLALILKKVSDKDEDVIYSLQGMICTKDELNCKLVFDKDFDFGSIMSEFNGIIHIQKLSS